MDFSPVLNALIVVRMTSEAWIGLSRRSGDRSRRRDGGMLLRWWSVRVLAEYFTVDVSIRADHRIVRGGPYRFLRHPSHTGALASLE